MTMQSTKSLGDYVLKSDISEHHVDILSNLFASLALANQRGIETDHSSDDPNIMTLDVDQVRHAMREHRHKLITNMEIIDAFSDLHAPKLLPDSVKISRQGNGGHRIMPVRLDYSESAETDNLAEELAQIDLGELSADEIDQCDASRRWMEKAMHLEETCIEQQDTIESLRAIIIEMAETLHVADPNARISVTSSDLLDLINSRNDISDIAF